MYLLIKKKPKVLFARNSSSTWKRERAPLTFHECLDTAPGRRQKSWMRWIIIFPTMSAFLYYMFYNGSSSRMKFQIASEKKLEDTNIILLDDNFNNKSSARNTEEKIISHRGKNSKTNTNNKLLDTITETDAATVIPEHVWKNKIEEFTSQRKINNKLSPCILNVTVREKVVHLTKLQNRYTKVKMGGYYYPEDCRSRHKVAILVPYRDREQNLAEFLYSIHPFLMRQKLEYRIFIIEQAGKQNFNRGRLFNVGFKEMVKFNDWRCVIFHDVDLLPLDNRILYTCPTYPRHMCATVAEKEKLSYNAYHTLFGGVVAMSNKHFEKINGYSNLYWGWGGEDNDLFWRIHALRLPTVRYDKSIARYTSLPHPKQRQNPHRYQLLQNAMERLHSDGLRNVKYRIISTTFHRLYTRILVDINPLKENITV